MVYRLADNLLDIGKADGGCDDKFEDTYISHTREHPYISGLSFLEYSLGKEGGGEREKRTHNQVTLSCCLLKEYGQQI